MNLQLTPPTPLLESSKSLRWGGGGDFRTGIARLELNQIAEANPGTTIAVVNNPGVGASAPIPKSSIKEMVRTGSFEPYGEILARHLAPTAGDYDLVSGAGHSMGARSFISLAPRLDNFDYLTATDPPGSRRLGLFGVANAFMRVEGRHSAEYKANTDNTAGLREQKAYDDGGFTNYLKSMSLPALWQFLISQPRAMGRSGLEGDLDTLAQTNKVGAVQITSPEMSALNSPRSVFEIMGRVATSGTQTKFQQVVLPGQTHSVVAGGNAHVTGILSTML